MICAHAVSVALKNFAGVEAVDVSLNKGKAAVKLRPGNTAKIEELWEKVRKNGFTPKETRVVVRGIVEDRRLKVTCSNETYDLAADPEAPQAMDEVVKRSGNTVTMEGRFTPTKDLKIRVPLLVRGLVDQGK